MHLLSLMFFECLIVCSAFNPSFKAILNPDGSATHETITRCSLAKVTSEYFKSRFRINITVPAITRGICPSSLFSRIQSAFSLTKYVGGSTYSRWEDMIDEIVDHNERVDVLEALDESRHFDSESFIDSSDVIQTRLQSASNAAKTGDYETSNEHFGRLLHTLQDFYSHSNWIEKDKRQPHPTLGVRRFISSQFAAPNVRTCKDCTTGPDAVCRGNCIVSNGLTSGYYIFGSDIFTKKPTGKCSHGGSTDATRNNDAIGGINKDALSSIHGYLHVPAAQTAYLATCKILREFRAQVGDVAFGKFLNVLSRRSTTSRSADSSSEENDKNSAYVYTSILKKLRKTDSFTIIRQIVTVPAIDFIYKAQILSLAKRKHVAIDIFCPAKFHQSSSDFGQDLATLTGGMFTLYDDDEQISIDMNPDDRPELIGVFYTKSSSNILTINIDQACSDLLLEFFSKHKIHQMQIQLRKGNQTISSPLIITDTKYYRSYRISNLSPGQWQLIISRSKAFIFDLHASCSSGLRCFSRVLVDNGNPIHPGQVELQGNLIEKQTAILMSTCDSTMIPIQTVQVMMIDSINGALLASPLRSVFDESSNRWMTNLTNIPSKQFRLKFSINHGKIIRLSRSSYQPSLVDVQITKVKANGKNKMMITYRVLNYYSQSMKLTLLVKNVGNFSLKRKYEVKAGGSKDDVFEYDSKDGQSNMISLTVKSAKGDWNYDVVSF